MADKSKSFAAENMVVSLFQGFDASALAAIQQRNLEAFARTTGIIATAATNIAEKQLEMLKNASEMRPAIPSAGKGESFSDVLASQMAAGRENFQKALQQANEVNDAVRQCYADIADELQCCAQDNWRSVRKPAETMEQQEKAAASAPRRVATA